MAQSQTLYAVHRFLQVVWEVPEPSDEALLESIDGLLCAYHQTPDKSDAAPKIDPPDRDWKATRTASARRFPDYGFYAVTDPLDLAMDQGVMTGDVIDDIADIAREMSDVLWYAENAGQDAAHWAFRDSYPHWGNHARELAPYLFARLRT